MVQTGIMELVVVPLLEVVLVMMEVVKGHPVRVVQRVGVVVMVIFGGGVGVLQLLITFVCVVVKVVVVAQMVVAVTPLVAVAAAVAVFSLGIGMV